MNKVAWFITHDDYIDRRIFFFVDVLKQCGYQVKLFPYMYFNILSAEDPAFVIRPHTEKILREYNVPVDDLEEAGKFLSVVAREYCKSGNKSRYFKSSAVKLMEENDGISIVYYKDDIVFCYHCKYDSYSKLYVNANDILIQKCERAIAKALPDWDRKKSIEIDEVMLTARYNAQFEECIYAQVKNDTHLYSYNPVLETLSEVIPMQVTDKMDCLEGKSFDYTDFRQIIYDYSLIFTCVQQELKHEIPDVVYVADLPTLPIGIMLKKTTDCQLIMDCHEWWWKQTILWEPDLQNKIDLVDKYERELYPLCDICITVGEYLASRMQEHIGCEFGTIYSCMSQTLMNTGMIEEGFLQSKYGLPKDTKILIFQGGMSTHRNLDNLARMTRYFSEDVYLLLLTTGMYQSVFKEILVKEGNPERVIWGGWIKQEELLRYTKSADFGIIPYIAVNDYAECFVPNKLMEYFESQLPMFYDASLKELQLVAGGNNVGIELDLKNPAEAGKRINELMHNKTIRDNCVANYHKSNNKFCYDGQKTAFEIMLQKIGI